MSYGYRIALEVSLLIVVLADLSPTYSTTHTYLTYIAYGSHTYLSSCSSLCFILSVSSRCLLDRVE